MKIDFTKATKRIKLNFRPCIYMRDRTHSYLWLRDGRAYGYFLTIDSGTIEVVKLKIVNGVYRVNGTWNLEPFADPRFEKAVRRYWESTMGRTDRAEQEMCSILGTEPGKLAIQDIVTSQPQPEKPVLRPQNPASGYSLADLCEEIGMDASDARKKLRGRVEKPGSKWEWVNRNAAAYVRALLMESQI